MNSIAETVVCVIMMCLLVTVTVTTLVSVFRNRKNRRLRISFRDTANTKDIVSAAESRGCTVLGINRSEDNTAIILHLKASGGESGYCSLLSYLASLDQVVELGEETEPEVNE